MTETTDATRQDPPAQDSAPRSARLRRMLTEKQVLEIVPVSRRTLYRMVKRDVFPSAVFASPNKKFWYEDEVIAWQQALDEHGRLRRLRRVAPDKSAADAARVDALEAVALLAKLQRSKVR